MRLPPHQRGKAMVSVLLLCGMLSSSCTGQAEPGPNEQGATRVTYLTNFGNLGRDSYVYVAHHKGYFREVGIEVNIQPGSGTEPNLTGLVGGQADFATVDMPTATIAYGNGMANWTAIAAIHQRNMLSILSFDPEMLQPTDLEGMTIAVAPGAGGETLFPIYAQLNGLDLGEIELVTIQPDGLFGVLLGNQVDGIGQFRVAAPALSAAGGREVSVLPFDIPDLYGTVLVTTPAHIASTPGLVSRFRDALMRGLADALADPTGAASILAQYIEGTKEEAAAAELILMQPYSAGDATTTLGEIRGARVAQQIALLQSHGAIDPGITPGELVDFDLVPKA